VDERWKALQNSLSGLFCASLGRMDTLHTTSPTRTFPATGDLPRLLPAPHAPAHTHVLRHATLPAERVCTENLTPFLKLLPCPARAGIAALLEPHKIFDADWHGLGVHVRWRAGAGVELVLSAQAVFDPVRISAERRRGERVFPTAFAVRGEEGLTGEGAFRLVAALALRSFDTARLCCCHIQRGPGRAAIFVGGRGICIDP
jgi:hypothetical protein